MEFQLQLGRRSLGQWFENVEVAPVARIVPRLWDRTAYLARYMPMIW